MMEEFTGLKTNELFGLVWPCGCSGRLRPLGGTVHPSVSRNARTSPLFLVCVSLHFPHLCVALSAGLCHCANSWSGLPELIIAFP